mmetsp:Transcript_16004/g.40451  ORF Transcript_16004/g.40451 Transcript_16004/m.40451 type:complete len:266 (-) Transcript_16004:62-859(-)
MKESPRFLYVNGRGEEAASIVRHIAEKNRVSFHFDSLARPTADGSKPKKGAVRDLFRRTLRKETLLLWFIWFFVQCAFTGFNFFFPVILQEKGIAATDRYLSGVLYNVSGIPGSLIGASIVETKLGRRFSLVIFLTLAGACLGLFILAENTWQAILLSCIMQLASQSAWSIIYTYTPECYPTTLRVTGMGAASATSRIAGIAVPLLQSVLLKASLSAALATSAAFFVATAVAAVFLRETRGQDLYETMEEAEAEAELRRKRKKAK